MLVFPTCLRALAQWSIRKYERCHSFSGISITWNFYWCSWRSGTSSNVCRAGMFYHLGGGGSSSGVETTPLGGCPDMREFQQRQCRSLRSSRKHGVLSIFVIERPECPIGNGRSDEPVASDPPFCVSTSGCDSAHVHFGEGLPGGFPLA